MWTSIAAHLKAARALSALIFNSSSTIGFHEFDFRGRFTLFASLSNEEIKFRILKCSLSLFFKVKRFSFFSFNYSLECLVFMLVWCFCSACNDSDFLRFPFYFAFCCGHCEKLSSLSKRVGQNKEPVHCRNARIQEEQILSRMICLPFADAFSRLLLFDAVFLLLRYLPPLLNFVFVLSTHRWAVVCDWEGFEIPHKTFRVNFCHFSIADLLIIKCRRSLMIGAWHWMGWPTSL